MQETIRECLSYGCLAPSVHNLQPWRVALKDTKATIKVHHTSELDNSDPTHRESWVSVGAFVENVLQAAPALGAAAHIIRADYAKGEITVEFTKAKVSRTPALENIKNRLSNRAPLGPMSLSADQLKRLKALSSDLAGVRLDVVTQPEVLEQVAELTGQAIALALSMPQFKRELADTFRHNASSKKTGIPGYALNLGFVKSLFQTLRFKYLHIAPHESQVEAKRIRDSAGLCLISSEGDIAKHWFNAGRLYERTALLLTEFGLGSSTSAAVVEAPDFHQEVEKSLGTPNRLQAILRFGAITTPAKPSPRLSLDDILE